MKKTQENAISAKIKQSPMVVVTMADGSCHYFGSLAAIYQVFTPQDIGVTLRTLWNHKITDEQPYRNAHCTIRRATLIRMAQKA